MNTVPGMERLSSAAREELLAAFKQVEVCGGGGNEEKIDKAKEKLADLLNVNGFHEESIRHYQDLERHSSSLIDQSRLLRKISASYLAQRQIIKAHRLAEKALGLSRKADVQDIDVAEYFETLIACSYANYFISNRARHEVLIKEMKIYFPLVTNPSVRLRFFEAILLDILLRYRWYMLPEESITHAEYYLHLAAETKNLKTLAMAYHALGFIHLWREGFERCRENFAKAVDLLQNRNLESVLVSQVYTTVSYRMQNNTAMTEKWALASMEIARKTKNEIYQALSYGNMAWVYIKRGNWLYAEDHARKGLSVLASFRFPMVYICLFPLLECLYRSDKIEEAGTYGYLLLHPSLKRLPDSIYDYLKQMSLQWLTNNKEETKVLLKELIDEAKLTNYF